MGGGWGKSLEINPTSLGGGGGGVTELNPHHLGGGGGERVVQVTRR